MQEKRERPKKSEDVDLKQLIRQREKVHGSFKRNSSTYRKLHNVVFDALAKNGVKVSDEEFAALTSICFKLARATSSQAALREDDHFRDIAGYVTLILESRKAEQRRRKNPRRKT